MDTTRKKPLLLVGSATDCPDVEYASGFRSTDPVVFLRTRAGQYLVVADMEYGRALRVGGRTQVLTPERLGLRGRRRKRLSNWILQLLRRLAIRSVCVSPLFPLGVARRLERRNIRVSIAEGDLFPERAVKSGVEIRKIREAQQAAVLAMRAAIAMIASSEIDGDGYLRLEGKRLTAERVRRRIWEVLLQHDCLGKETIVACGKQAADPHETGQGPLRAHEAIVMDIFPQHLIYGYWGDLTRTVVRGKAPAALRKMFLAVKTAQAAALEQVRPGVKGVTVHRTAVREFCRRGFETGAADGRSYGFIHGTGHGVGLAIHETPSVSLGDARLKSGHVITIEPGLYYPDIGGVRIEDTVVVTPGGWKYLVPCEKRFEV